VAVVTWSGAEESLWGAVSFTPTIQTYSRFDEAVEALSLGNVDAVADLRQRLFWGKFLFPETAIVGQYTSAPLAIAFPQNDAFFADLVNLTFQEMVADGTLAALYARWFDPEQPPAVERWPGEGVPALMNTPMTTDARDTITAIQSRGRLAVAMINGRAPFAYLNEEGSPIGYDVSLVRAMAERWLNDAAAVDVMSVQADTGIELLRTGQVDLLIGGVAHDRATEMSIDLSLTTYVAGEGLMIQAGSPISTMTSLQGQQVAVLGEGQSREVLLAAAQSAGVSLTVLPQPSVEAAIVQLQEGQVAAIAADRAVLLGPAYATPGLGVLPLRLTQIPLALGLPPGDSAFCDLVDLTLQTMKSDGQLDAIYSAWFDDAPPTLEVWPGTPYRTLRLR
jgi:ABC-type amino acid transport substrate-binding protein